MRLHFRVKLSAKISNTNSTSLLSNHPTVIAKFRPLVKDSQVIPENLQDVSQAEEQGEKILKTESRLKKLENKITVTSTERELKQHYSVRQELEQIFNSTTDSIILITLVVWCEEGQPSNFSILRKSVNLKPISENS